MRLAGASDDDDNNNDYGAEAEGEDYVSDDEPLEDKRPTKRRKTDDADSLDSAE